MADLSMFSDESFDLIVHPVSNSFAPDIRKVWTEAFRVLRSGGVLVSGFTNPMVYLFDYELAESSGILQIKYKLPYSDADSLTEEKKQRLIAQGVPIEFSHSLEDQLGGQLDAGFVITGLYEDSEAQEENDLLARYTPTYIATRALKP